MREAVLAAVLALAVGLRLWRYRRRRAGQATGGRSTSSTAAVGSGNDRGAPGAPAGRLGGRLGSFTNPIALIAAREIRERTRSRVFRVGTLIILLVVAAAVVIPVLRRSSKPTEGIGVIGALSAPLRAGVVAAADSTGVRVTLVPESSVAAAETDLRAGRIGLAIDQGRRLIVDRAPSATDTSRGALVLRAVSQQLSLQGGLETAGIPPDRAAVLAHPPPLPVVSLQPARSHATARATAVYGLILEFVLLTQYGTWILMGVVEEKSSRVVEVLLSTVRPTQLLAGKVTGIGLVALAQSALLVAVALGLGAAVGSDLLKGTAPVEVVTVLVWLVLGYAFYCWVYAAGGALAERQEHIQTLAFPLQLPILFGYIVSLTQIGSTNPSTLLKVLAYLPPTAPFAMSVLVALSRVNVAQVVASAAISVAATVAVARLAATVYSRAILRTGHRVRLGEVLGRRDLVKRR